MELYLWITIAASHLSYVLPEESLSLDEDSRTLWWPRVIGILINYKSLRIKVS